MLRLLACPVITLGLLTTRLVPPADPPDPTELVGKVAAVDVAGSTLDVLPNIPDASDVPNDADASGVDGVPPVCTPVRLTIMPETVLMHPSGRPFVLDQVTVGRPVTAYHDAEKVAGLVIVKGPPPGKGRPVVPGKKGKGGGKGKGHR